MKHIKNFRATQLLLVSMFVGAYAFAGDTVSPQDFLTQVLDSINKMGGLTWVLKVASIITLIIASMKVSVLNDMIWSKMGNFKAWLAPILGLAAGLLSLAAGGHLSLADVLAWLSAGAGAVVLHELLDTIKAIPGLGDVYVNLIDAIENALGGPASK